ncbi:unnamed protein product [Symbiodinium sp. CCMP2592]|nr:unnamed protein product [Symbiodinium sp. CCMP2592]
MARGDRRDGDRDRGHDGREERGRTTRSEARAEDLDSLRTQVEKVEAKLTRTSHLALQASKDSGEVRSAHQLVLFVKGLVRERLKEVVALYQSERDAVVQGLKEKGAPLKVRLYDALLKKLQEFAATEADSVAKELLELGASSVLSSVTNGAKPPEGDVPWVLVLTFSYSELGQKAKRLWCSANLRPCFAKTGGGWPELGWRLSAGNPAESEDFPLPAPGFVEQPSFVATSGWGRDQEGWNRDRQNWWVEPTEESQHWDWQEQAWEEGPFTPGVPAPGRGAQPKPYRNKGERAPPPAAPAEASATEEQANPPAKAEREDPPHEAAAPEPAGEPTAEPASQQWVFVRDLLEEGQVIPAGSPAEGATATPAPSTGAGRPAEEAGTANQSLANSTVESLHQPGEESEDDGSTTESSHGTHRSRGSPGRFPRKDPEAGAAAVANAAASGKHRYRGRTRQQRGATGDEWERFVWQLETYAAMIDPSFPQHLEEARKGSGDDEDDATLTTESEEYRILSVKLFGMLVSLVSECPAAFKIARGIRRQDGFLLWKQLWKEFHPEQANRGLIWRRAILSPKFPHKEADFAAALQEWESDLAKYEAEFGADKAIFEEDKHAVLMLTVREPRTMASEWGGPASSLYQEPHPAYHGNQYIYVPDVRPRVLVRWHMRPRVGLFHPEQTAAPIPLGALTGQRRTLQGFANADRVIWDDRFTNPDRERSHENLWRGRTELEVDPDELARLQGRNEDSD